MDAALRLTTALLARLQGKRSFLLSFTQTIAEKEMANSGALERVPAHQGSEIPGRVINLDQAVARHGDKADYMVRMLSVGDPLADAVIVEMDALGKEGRRILNAGLADGLADLTERPPATTALLQQLDTHTARVDPA